MNRNDGPAMAGEPPARDSIARDSIIVGGATVLSRVLGFVRDILIARMLGAGPVADAFLVAFRLPNLFRRVLGEGGLNAPFVPLYLTIKGERSPEEARRFAGETLAQFGIVLAILAALTEILAPWLVLALAGGFKNAPVTLALAESYTRLALPFLAFTVFASLIAAILNAEKRFAIAAFAPLVLNVTLIGTLLHGECLNVDSPHMAKTLAIAVSGGGVLHLLIVALALKLGRPGWPRLRLRWSPDMTRLIILAVPSLIAASTSQLVLLVATQIASSQPGAVSWLYYADRVFQMPLGFVAVAMGVVLLPEIARREAAGDAAGRRDTVNRALVLGLAIAIPAATALCVIAEPIVAVLFERGKFGPLDRDRTAAALAAFAPGLPLAVVAKVLAQVFFARQAPLAPLVAGLASLVVAIVAGYHLAPGMPASGAAAAASLAFLVQSLVLMALLMRDRLWRISVPLALKVMAICAASLVMALALHAASGVMQPYLIGHASGMVEFMALAGLCLMGMAVYALVASLLKVLRLRDLSGFRG